MNKNLIQNLKIYSWKLLNQACELSGNFISKDTDLLLIHFPFDLEMWERRILHDKMPAAVIPSTQVFELYPIGWIEMVNYLKKFGYKVRILNLANWILTHPGENISKVLRHFQPKLIGTDLHWMPHVLGVEQGTKLMKEFYPDTPIVVGGISSTIFHEELISWKNVDYVLRGDSTKEPLRILLDYVIKQKGNLADIPNLTFKDNNDPKKIKINPLSYVEKEVSDEANNYFDLFCHIIKTGDPLKATPYYGWFDDPMVGIKAFIGCLQNCAICGGSQKSYQEYGRKKIAKRKPEKLANDIAGIARYSKSSIFVIGDPRMGGKSYAINFLKALKEKSIPNPVALELFGPASNEYLKILGGAGSRIHLEISPEVHDYELRKKLGKNYTNEELYETIEKSLKYGVKSIHIYLMLGLPGQTEESARETIRWGNNLMKKYEQVEVLFSPLVFFLDPCSPASSQPQKYGVKNNCHTLKDYLNLLNQGEIWPHFLNYETEYLTRDKIEELTYWAAKERIKALQKIGKISALKAKEYLEGIEKIVEINQAIDKIVKNNSPGKVRTAKLQALKITMNIKPLLTTTLCGDIRWPGAGFHVPRITLDFLKRLLN